MYTLSWHNQGSRANQAHNTRQTRSVGRASNIDHKKTKHNITLVHEPIKEAYKKLFQESVDEYNEKQIKQGHSKRVIKDYYTEIEKSKKHTCYEIIVQIGSLKEGTPMGMEQAAYSMYVEDFKKRNPNLYVVEAYIHNDEAGACHLHLDYIPFATCKRGMKIQNTLTGALKAQGFISNSKSDTAQIRWEQSERDEMRRICNELQIPLQEQGIGHKRHLEVSEYKEAQEQIKALNGQIKVLEEQKEYQQNIINTLIGAQNDIKTDLLSLAYGSELYRRELHSAIVRYEPNEKIQELQNLLQDSYDAQELLNYLEWEYDGLSQ